jgi:hypothetical protein
VNDSGLAREMAAAGLLCGSCGTELSEKAMVGNRYYNGHAG